MKFFIPLGFQYDGRRSGPYYHHLGTIHGPFKNAAECQKAMKGLTKDTKMAQRFLILDGEHIKITTGTDCYGRKLL